MVQAGNAREQCCSTCKAVKGMCVMQAYTPSDAECQTPVCQARGKGDSAGWGAWGHHHSHQHGGAGGGYPDGWEPRRTCTDGPGAARLQALHLRCILLDLWSLSSIAFAQWMHFLCREHLLFDWLQTNATCWHVLAWEISKRCEAVRCPSLKSCLLLQNKTGIWSMRSSLTSTQNLTVMSRCARLCRLRCMVSSSE